jgi:hypothetical protein
MDRRYTKPLLFRHGTRAGIDHSNPIRRSLTGPLNTIPTPARLCRKKIGLHQCPFLAAAYNLQSQPHFAQRSRQPARRVLMLGLPCYAICKGPPHDWGGVRVAIRWHGLA